ncbi:hypothetical protein EON66_04200 [archaeon]|nr:MAG: hypothetical protein EON66_04200 [archaeon]
MRTLREDPAWWASLSTHQLLAYDFKSFAWGEAAADVAAALPAPTHHSAASVPRGSLCGTFGASSLGMPVLQALQQADSTPAAEADRAASTASHASPPSASSTPSPPPQDSRRAHSDKDTPACVMLSSHVARELRAFARENSLDFLVLMSLDASLKRQLALSYTAHLCDNPAERMSREQFDAFRRALEHESSLQLRAVPLAASRSEADEVAGEPVYAYLQGNATASRKQVVPIIQHLLCSLHL